MSILTNIFADKQQFYSFALYNGKPHLGRVAERRPTSERSAAGGSDMRWPWQTSFHNSREYIDGPPKFARVGQFELTIAWLLDAARRGFAGLLRPTDLAHARTIMLKTGSHRGFTVLGLPDSGSEHSDAAMAPCVFPENQSNASRPRKPAARPEGR
jgi:hypothetical protein